MNKFNELYESVLEEKNIKLKVGTKVKDGDGRNGKISEIRAYDNFNLRIAFDWQSGYPSSVELWNKGKQEFRTLVPFNEPSGIKLI